MTQSTEVLLNRVRNGDESAMEALLAQHRGRLQKMIRARLHPKVRTRVDESDILQEALLNASLRMNDFFARSSQPFFLWLRAVATQVLQQCHRMHLDALKRSVKRDQPQSMADDSLSQNMTQIIISQEPGPADAVERQELPERVVRVLDSMSANDREVLCMRHFEGMGNREVAEALGISTSNASTRYLRALTRLQDELKRMPGFY